MGALPGSRRPLAAAIIARLPLAMLGVGLVIHAQQWNTSFAHAGTFAGTFAAAYALAFATPLLGSLIDRGEQTSVLPVTIAVLPTRAPLPVLVARGR